jgi:hypothetical protein
VSVANAFVWILTFTRINEISSENISYHTRDKARYTTDESDQEVPESHLVTHILTKAHVGA